MPKRKLPREINGVCNNTKDVKRPRLAANGHKLPDPLPKGEILTDIRERKWKLGRSIGLGGFGEIYLASEVSMLCVGKDARYVIKIEPHSNGPLFSEMHFYFRVGKPESIEEWKRKKKLNFLGMPKFIGSGSHEFNGVKYRFMILERFGDDLQKLLDKNHRVFPLKTVYTLGIKILDVLEYVHSHGYVHGDVKAANLMSGFSQSDNSEVHLIDFGLACKYLSQGVHKEYKEDLRKAHDGTIEYTSRDAHIGAHSRRGDLEILGYNMLQWICRCLPWEDNLKDPEQVFSMKKKYMNNIPSLMKACFPWVKAPDGIVRYLEYIARLKFEEKPDYSYCRDILKTGIQSCGFKCDGKLVFTLEKSFVFPISRKKHMTKTRNSPMRKMKRTDRILSRTASESASIISIPYKKVRRVASATPRLQSVKTSAPSVSEYISTIDNPTPAMLLVMQRKVERLQQGAELPGNVFQNNSGGDSHSKNPYVNSDNERAFVSSQLKVNKSSTNDGHCVTKVKYRLKQTKSLEGTKKQHLQRVDVLPMKKQVLKKMENKPKNITSPIAGRTRYLQKIKDKSTFCGLRSLNIPVPTW